MLEKKEERYHRLYCQSASLLDYQLLHSEQFKYFRSASLYPTDRSVRKNFGTSTFRTCRPQKEEEQETKSILLLGILSLAGIAVIFINYATINHLLAAEKEFTT